MGRSLLRLTRQELAQCFLVVSGVARTLVIRVLVSPSSLIRNTYEMMKQ